MLRRARADSPVGDDLPSSSTVVLRSVSELRQEGDRSVKRKRKIHLLEQVNALKEGKVMAKKAQRAAEREKLHGPNPGLALHDQRTFLESQWGLPVRSHMPRHGWKSRSLPRQKG